MPIPVDYAQTNLYFGGVALPQGAEVTMGWDISSYPSSPAQLAEDVFTSCSQNILDNVVEGVTLTGCLAKFGPDATGPSALFSANSAGSIAGEGVPPQVSVLMRKHTSSGGRAGRGRSYWPGAQMGGIDESGTIDGVVLTAWQTACVAFINQVASELATAVVLHGAGSPLTTPSPITSVTVDGTLATQRRRLRG